MNLTQNTEFRIQDLIKRGQLQEAEQLIGHRISQEPANADLHYLMGVLEYFRSNLGSSIHWLKKALSVDPKHTDAAICLSVLLNDIGKYDSAKQVFEQANHSVSVKATSHHAAVDKKFAVKHLELADLYFRYRRYEEAIEEYGKAALLDPSALDIRIRRAKAYAKKGFLTRALQELQQLKHEHPSYLPARIQLGLLQYSQGNVLDAELEWESILQTHPGHREAAAYLEIAKKSRTAGSVYPTRQPSEFQGLLETHKVLR